MKSATKLSRYLKLNSGHEIPRIGLGSYQMKNETLVSDIKHAIINAGYRHVDTAKDYKNEEYFGEALSQVFKTTEIKRSDMFVVTKLWNEEKNSFDEIESALQTSMKKLQTDYIDLYLIHWPCGKLSPNGKNWNMLPMKDTWSKMEEFVQRGLVKSIGVCNVNAQLMHDMLTYAKIWPAVVQMEIHPYYPQKAYIDWLQSVGINVICYAPLSSPMRPFKTPFDKNLLENDFVNELGAKYNKGPSQIILNWHLNRNHVPIPKPAILEHIDQNIDVFDFCLEQSEVDALTNLDTGSRTFDPKYWDHWNNIPIFD